MTNQKISRRLMLSATLILAAPLIARAEVKLTPSKSNDHTQEVQSAIDEAARGSGILHLGPGKYRVANLTISKPITITGVPGRTRLIAKSGPALRISSTNHVTLQGLAFEGSSTLLEAVDTSRLMIDDCIFTSGARGIALERCAGRVRSCQFSGHADAALFALDSTGLEISSSTVLDCGNNGIQVWRSAPGEDGTIVTHNRIATIAAREGGTGQYGNGISVFRAGNVMISNNRVTDCAYSAVRNNGGSGVQIIANNVARCNETALYSEFEFKGCIISNNMLEDVAFGISIANFDVDGRLAICANNIIRNVPGGHLDKTSSAGGIHCEADTLVSGNLIEDVRDYGIHLGWGRCRNLTAADNIIRNMRHGIEVSVAEGAQSIAVTGNTIKAEIGIIAMDHHLPQGGDLLIRPDETPAHVLLSANRVGT